MSNALNISDKLKLPASIGTETIALLGRRGSGKSNTGTVLMEELHAAGQQFVLIDPKGEGWGLKAQGTGGPGLKDVIAFGEPEGDLPLREEHGEMIADFVVSSGKSCVLSVSGLDSDAAQRRFVARFCERLYALKKKPQHHSPLMVVIEEAHLFVPQRVEGAQADVVSRIQRLVRQGRSMGLGVTLIDQRPASVNKDVLTQIELMVCHQLTGPHDRKAVDAWIEANAEKAEAEEFRRTLPTLQPGEAWVWSPAKLKIFQRATIRRRNTFDSGSTPILGKGVSAKRPKMREVDLEQLRGQLDKVVQERKANDPAELKKALAARDQQIVELKKQVDAKPAAAAKVKTVEKPVISEKVLARLEKLQERAGERATAFLDRQGVLAKPLADALAEAQRQTTELVAAARSVRTIGAAPLPEPADRARARAIIPKHIPAQPAQRVPITGSGPGETSVTGGIRRVLSALAQRNGLTNRQLGARATVRITSSTFRGIMATCRRAGWIRDEGDHRFITDAGVAALGTYTPLPTGSGLREHWRTELGEHSKQWKALACTIAAFPGSVNYEEIAEATGTPTTSSTFRGFMSDLRKLELVAGGVQGVTANAELFDAEER